METDHVLHSTSILSESYMRGIERITGNQNKQLDAFGITEVMQTRKQEWAMLFEKFSQVSDDLELYIRTLELDTESSECSDYRVPVRKSAAEVQYWVDTGNPPCQAFEASASDTDVTISISESEGSGLVESQSSTQTSLVVTKQLASSREQLLGTCSSGSSVDTTAYILTNSNTTRKANLPFDKDPRISNITNTNNNCSARLVGNKIPKVVLTRMIEHPKVASILDNNAILQTNMPLDLNCISEKGPFEPDAISATGHMTLAEHVGPIDGCNSNEHKHSEATKSTVDTFPIESEKTTEKSDMILLSDSSNEVVTVSQKRNRKLRKLYSVNHNVSDDLTPMIQKYRDRRSLRNSIHPALVNSPSMYKLRKSVYRPPLFTLTKHSKIRKFKNRSINTSFAKNKLKKKSSLTKSRGAEDSRRLHRDSPGSMAVERNDKIHLGQETIVSPTKKTSLEASPILHTTLNDVMKSDDPAAASSSLSLQDVSEIINEEINRIEKTHASVAGKHILKQSCPAGSQRLENRHEADDQGSVFTPPADSLSEMIGSRTQNIFDAKKNLYSTDLKSSSDTNSSLVPSPSKIQVAEDDGSEKSTSLSSKLRRRRRSFTSSTKAEATPDLRTDLAIAARKPIIILHDFLHLKNCCGELEKQHNKKWLSKRYPSENLYIVEDDINEQHVLQENSVQKDDVSFTFKQSFNHRSPEMNKSKLYTKSTFSKSDNNIISTQSIDLVTDDLCLSEKILSPLKTHEPIKDVHYASTTASICRPEAETSMQLSKGGKATVKTTGKNCKSQASIFYLSSSDEEDILEMLTRRLKSRSSRKTGTAQETGGTASIDQVENNTVRSPKKFQGPELNSVRYKIVSSSSEDEENATNMRGSQHKNIVSSQKFRNLRSKKNNGKVAPKSEQTTSSVQDECVDKSDSFRRDDQKLDRQSLDVNERFEMKKRNPVDNEVQNYNESHGRMKENSPKTKLPISDKTDNTGTTLPITCTKENVSPKESEHTITPIAEALNDRSKLGKNKKENTGKHRDAAKKLADIRMKKKRKSDPKIDGETGADSVRAEADLELGRVQSYKNRRKSFCEKDKVDEVIGANTTTSSGGKRLLVVSSDKSFENDDPTISRFMNCAGTNSQGKNNGNNDESCSSNSLKGSENPTKQGLMYKKDMRSSSNKISVNRQKNSKIIFCTKEYWESDSDYS